MDDITVAIVDDNEVDRYIVRRHLTKAAGFGAISESVTGDRFLDEMYNGNHSQGDLVPPLLVLMDINMPRLDGFKTVEEIQDRMRAGLGPNSIVVMMFSSSDSPQDHARAEALDIVKGYICKPLDAAGIDTIRRIYADRISAFPPVGDSDIPRRPRLS